MSFALSSFVEDLTEDKPSSKLKLIIAWDSLSSETQINILYNWQNFNAGDLPLEIKQKAISSSHAYIRYLIARQYSMDKFLSISSKKEEEILEEYIKNDSSPLIKQVRPAHFSLEEFFQWSDEDRVAFIHHLNSTIVISGFYKIIEYAIENKISQTSIDFIIEEFVKNQSIMTTLRNERDSDDWDDWKQKSYQVRCCDELWKLPSLLKNTHSELTLAQNLPVVEEETLFQYETLENLSPNALIRFFSRDDVFLNNFRKKIICSSQYQQNRELINAACNNLFLSPEDFLSFLEEKEHLTIKALIKANNYFSELTPLYIEVLEDLRWAWYDHILNEDEDKYVKTTSVEKRQKRFFSRYLDKVSQKSEEEKNCTIKSELIKLSIYYLARYFCPWNKKSDLNYRMVIKENFFLLKDFVVPDDTWSTYIAFCNLLLGRPIYEHLLLSMHKENFSKDFSQFYYIPFEDEEFLFQSVYKKENISSEKINFLHRKLKTTLVRIKEIDIGLKIMLCLWGVTLTILIFK